MKCFLAQILTYFTSIYVRYFKPLPRFSIDKALGACTLHLPNSSPVQKVYAEGEIYVIKKVVCLKACQELHAICALTDYLLPELSVPCEDKPDIGLPQPSRNGGEWREQAWLHRHAAARTGLVAHACHGLRVMAANGDGTPCSGIAQATPFSINEEPFVANLYVLPLEGYDGIGNRVARLPRAHYLGLWRAPDDLLAW
jgi:hypothetical protein